MDFEDLVWRLVETLYDRIGAQPQDPMSAVFGRHAGVAALDRPGCGRRWFGALAPLSG